MWRKHLLLHMAYVYFVLCAASVPLSDTYGRTDKHDEASERFPLVMRTRLKHSGNGLFIL